MFTKELCTLVLQIVKRQLMSNFVFNLQIGSKVASKRHGRKTLLQL